MSAPPIMRILPRSVRWHRTARGIVAGALLVLVSVDESLRAEETAQSVEISVRSSVDERWQGFRKLGPIEHGKVYAIVSISEAPSPVKLVRPVKEGRLVRQLREALNSRGFTEIVAGQKPDVLLTVVYGRGYLRNPYLAGAMVDEISEGVTKSTIILPTQLILQRQAGYEEKIQEAQLEKLFICVSAWKYPESEDEKPASLWKTTMIVGGPHQYDLNQFTGAMLAAGADYFDRVINKEEVQIKTPVPEGSVTIGPLKVIDDDVPDKK